MAPCSSVRKMLTPKAVALDDLRVGMAEATLPLHGKYRHAGIDGPYESVSAGGRLP